MYIISNKQMEDIISYIEAWKDGFKLKKKTPGRTTRFVSPISL